MSLKQGWQTKITDSYIDDREGQASNTGQRDFRWQEGNAYRWVQNKTGGTVSAGAVLFHGTNDNTKAEVYSAGQSGKGTDLSLMAGVVVSTSIPNDYFGWIQTRGYCPVVSVDAGTAILAFDTLKGVNAATTAVKAVASGTAATYGRNIIALEAKASGIGTIKGEVQCFP